MIMGKRIAAAALLLTASGVAHAADLPARIAPAPYIAPVPVFTWTGAYFGINAGAASTPTRALTCRPPRPRTTASDDRPASYQNSDSGFTAGGQIGYNYEFGGFNAFGPDSGIVVGVEADAAYVGRTEDRHLHRQCRERLRHRHQQFPFRVDFPRHCARPRRLCLQPVPGLRHGRLRLRRRDRERSASLSCRAMPTGSGRSEA